MSEGMRFIKPVRTSPYFSSDSIEYFRETLNEYKRTVPPQLQKKLAEKVNMLEETVNLIESLPSFRERLNQTG